MNAGKVLVIEDEPVIGELLCEVLGLYEYESRAVLDGNEGIEAARDWKPDAIILDLMLPDVNGYEVCRSIKADPNTGDVGVMILTGMLAQSDRIRAFKAGADRYLTKPFQPDDIIRELKSIVRHRHQPVRQDVPFDFIIPSDFLRQVREYQNDLMRSTPLSTEQIERLGTAVAELAENVFTWRERSGGPLQLSFVCKIYKDRLEHILKLTAPEPGPATYEIFAKLLGGPAADPSLTALESLPIARALTRPVSSQAIDPDHGQRLALTYHFQ